MNRTTIDFGIDLGTTNSTIAVIDGTDARVIPNVAGSGYTPSAVFIDKRGKVKVGLEAKHRALVEDPENADLEFKLRMGRGQDGKKRFERSDREMLPEELSAEVLKNLKQDVRTNLGEELGTAVITVPAAFEHPQTHATQLAAGLAGFGTVPLLLEPVAASLAYGFQSESENVYWFVYDFGGGTFDAAIMRIRDGLIQVVNHDGDNFLGGKLLDWDIVTRKLVPALTDQFNLPDFRRGNVRWARAFGKLKHEAEMKKIEVCRSRAPAEIWIEGLCEDVDGNSVDFEFTLTPQDVEEISAPFIAKSLSLARKTLSGANLTGDAMERILMVGGTTLNPWVREAVQAELGSRVEFGIDPVTVVARGAAIFASTQRLPEQESVTVPAGTWRIEIEHEPVGNAADPDIGGRVMAPDGASTKGCTIEFVDSKTSWRSGRLDLDASGVFMTQLYAEKKRRHEFSIELCDATGTRLPTAPDRVSYTLGVVPDKSPPAVMTIGIGLANGAVATYVKKGARLPITKSLDHITTQPLRAGREEDELRIPLLEGEHARAERNHGIGVMIIRGSDIRRDLPAGSQLEVTLDMSPSQSLRLTAYVNALDEEFDATFEPQCRADSLGDLVDELETQKERLSDARAHANGTPRADEVLSRIDAEQVLDRLDSLREAAETDGDAVAELDRRLRELASAVDEVEDSARWPGLLDEARGAREDVERLVGENGTQDDRARLLDLTRELDAAIDTGDADLLRLAVDQLAAFHFELLDRQPGFHVARFNWLVEQVPSMTNPEQAERLVAQGRQAINNNDVDALKAANRQLISMLPPETQKEAKHVNVGGTITSE